MFLRSTLDGQGSLPALSAFRPIMGEAAIVAKFAIAIPFVVVGVMTPVLAVSSGTQCTTMYRCQRPNEHTDRCEQDTKTESENYFMILVEK